jgi:hypothetical protein
MLLYKAYTALFNMLTNIGRVNEIINERRENLCSFLLFDILEYNA